MRVLIVDDELELGAMLKAFLDAEGHEVRTLANGMDTVALIEEWQPAVVLLDVMLTGITGYDVLRDIRRLAQPPRVWLMSAYHSMNTAAARLLGAKGFLRKPFVDLDQVLRAVEAS